MRGEYICRVDAMGKITSSETQKALRTMTGEEAYVTVVGILNELPAADVAPVVRCKDCIHACPAAHPEYVVCDIMECCRGLYKDDFCSCGERKDGDVNG